MPDQTDRTELHRLLGLPRHLPADELRCAYEQAMKTATRAGNMHRAMQLLKAFEGLSDPRRGQFYGRPISSPSRPMPGTSTVTSPAARAARRRSSRPPRRPRERKYGMARWARLLVYLVIAPAAIVGIVESRLHPMQDASPGYAPAMEQTSAAPILEPVSTASSPALGSASTLPLNSTQTVPAGYVLLRVPSGWPVRPDGTVWLLCDTPTGIGLTQQARPGSVLICPAGSHVIRVSP